MKDREAWHAAVCVVAESCCKESNTTEQLNKNKHIVLNKFLIIKFHTLEKAMATHSSVLAWRIPGIGEPGGLPSLGLHRVEHD